MTKTIKILTETECNLLLDRIKVHREGKKQRRDAIRNEAILLIMLDAGLRVGEVCKLKRNCIMFAGSIGNALTVPASITKTKQERTIPISERLRQAIQKLYTAVWLFDAGLPHSFAFYGSDPNKGLSERQVQRIIDDIAKSCLTHHVHPHTLRHTFATRLMKITNIRVVQKLLGHKSITSTQIYTHPNNEDMTEAIGKMNQ